MADFSMPAVLLELIAERFKVLGTRTASDPQLTL